MPNMKKSHPLLRLWGYARAHRRAMVTASLYSVLNKLFDLAPPLLIGAAVDTVVEQGDSLLARLGISDVGNQLLVLAGLTVVIWGFESFFQSKNQETLKITTIQIRIHYLQSRRNNLLLLKPVFAFLAF